MPENITERSVSSTSTGFSEVFDGIKSSTPEEANRALLYMLEDLQEMMSFISTSRKEWEDTVDSISDPLFIHDRDFKVIKCNRTYKELAGAATFNEIIGRPYFEFFPKMDGPFNNCLKAVKEEAAEEENEFSMPAINKIFKVRHYPINNTDGKLLYSVHLMEDVTEIKRAEQLLRDSEEKFRSVAASAQDGIVIMNNEGLISYWNEAAGKIFGYSAEEVLGKDAYVLLAPERYYEAFKEGFDQFKSTGQGPLVGKTLELVAIRKSGAEFPVELSVSAVRFKDGWNAIGTLRDITDRKLAEDRIRHEMEVTKHLLMIAKSTAHLTDPNKFMASSVECVRQITGCDVCLSYLWEDEIQRFKPFEEAGLSQNLTPYFRTESIGMDIPLIKKATEKDFEVVENYATLDESCFKAAGCGFFRLIKDLDRIVVIPLKGKNDIFGLLVCLCLSDAKNQAALSAQRALELYQGIAYQVSIGLENVLLYRNSINRTLELSRKVETIQTMHEIDRSILSTLDSHEILEMVVLMVIKIISCDRATVALINNERNEFYYAAGFGTSVLKKGEFVPFSDTNSTEVIKTGRPQYISNLKEVKRLLPLEKSFLDEGFLSHLRMPLSVKGECIGVLSVGMKQPSAFTPEDLSTLEKFSAQLSVALENSRLLQDVEDLFISTIRVLSNTIDAKSPWTKGHSRRVTDMAINMGKEMGLPEKELKKLEVAGLLHDIGKIGTYETILDKPGKLTEEELNIMRRHPLEGAAMLEPIKQMRDVIIPAIKYHHEFYDGHGYPSGLKGEEVPLMARILAVADTVDAMGADRPYRNGRKMNAIIDELKKCSGTQFDPKIVDIFLKTIINTIE